MAKDNSKSPVVVYVQCSSLGLSEEQIKACLDQGIMGFRMIPPTEEQRKKHLLEKLLLEEEESKVKKTKCLFCPAIKKNYTGVFVCSKCKHYTK